MKKILSYLLPLVLCTQFAEAQMANMRKRAIGISFIKNDFVTPQRIRTTSMSAVFRDNRWAEFSEMNSGVAITYFKGFRPQIDFATSVNFSSVNLPLPGKTFTEKHLLLEADASGNFKLLNEAYRVNPYLIAGVGASKYKNIYGAFVPVGGGIKVKIKDETQAFVQAQYRIPVTPEANNYHFQLSLGITGWLTKAMK